MGDDLVTATSVDLLSGGATLPWKVHPGVERIYDKALKSYVYQLPANGSQAVMQLPHDGKDLGIVQPFLVFQLFLPQNYRACLLEVAITDTTSARRWLLLGASTEEAHTTMRFARLPLLGLPRGMWFNLCVDLQSLVDGAFGQEVKSVDGIVIHPECRLRKIFTLRSLPNTAEVLDGHMIKVDLSGLPSAKDRLDQSEERRVSLPHLPDYAGIDTMFVMNADRVPNLEKAEAPAAPRAHPLQRRPALQPLQPAESLSPPRSPVKNDTRNEEMPKRHDDLPGIAERKSSKLTSSTKTSKTQKVPAITVAGSAGACYGHRPLSKQKFGSGYNQLPDRTVKVKEPKGLRTARGNKERLPQTRKLRPLPLEMKEDGTCQGIQGASQPSSSGSETLGSSRRERKTSKGRATEEEHGDSVTPSPTAAKRRAQRKLHKTAEIYGAPDAVGHTLRLPHALPRFERAEVNAGRSDTQVPLPTPSSLDPLVKTAALADIQLKPLNVISKVNAVRCDTQASPPKKENSLDPLVKTAALADIQLKPLNDISKVNACRSDNQASLPNASNSFDPLVKPTLADVPPKPTFDWSKAAAGATAVDAWSALSASVRHGDGPSFASLFRAGRQLPGGSPAETGTTEGCRARRRLSDKRGELDPLSGFGDQPRASQLSTIVPIQ